MDGRQAGSAEARVRELEEAIRRNRAAKKDIPDCPCWGNAPQWRDAELYDVLDDAREGEAVPLRAARLEDAIRRHRQDMKTTPECTCWITPARRADAALYKVLAPAADAADGTAEA